MMEVTQHLITLGLVVSLFLGFSNGDVLVQPGYNQVATQNKAEQTSTLEEEFQRYQTLQHLVENQIQELMEQQHSDPSAVGIYYPRLHTPFHINHGKLFSLTPTGIRGLHLGGYGLHRPLLLREATEEPLQAAYPGRHWRRSVRDESGRDAGSTAKIHDVASQSAIENDGVKGVVDIPMSQIHATDDSSDKLAEPREVGTDFSQIFRRSSPLDQIYYEIPLQYEPIQIGYQEKIVQPRQLNYLSNGYRYYDQNHLGDSSVIPWRVMNVAQTVGKMIDTVASGVTDSRVNPYTNKDPMSQHQNPSGNYQQYQQYHQPSHERQQGEPPSDSNVGTASGNQPAAGQSYSNEQQRNFGWRKMPQDQSSQSSNSNTENQRSQQPPASYPIADNAVNNNRNWLTATKQYYNGLPGYQNYPPPGYQNYFGVPPVYNNYRPPFPTSGASSSASAISTSSSNGNNYMGYPYMPAYKNPYEIPFGVTRIIDNFGRSVNALIPQLQ